MATAQETYHPSFSDPTADVVLQSTEGTFYRVHSIILRLTSGFFRTMLSLPQPNDPSTTAKIELHVGEPDGVMERVLRMMCGLEIPPWPSLDQVEAALQLIEKWDAPGPLSFIRTAITSPLFAEDPLRLYVLASRFGWEDEAKTVMVQTLKLRLFDGEHDDVLCRLPSRNLLVLLAFHDRCKVRFREALDGTALFSAGNEEPRDCNCGRRRDNISWRLLKAKLVSEFERRPLGDSILADMSGWPESVVCWRVVCACGNPYYDQVSTVRNLKQAIKDAIAVDLPVDTPEM
ncbi:BTB domain-containing protein [Favolaschia claudopus]|uniref:BTB domain-containing protein n=1 Tax=Favolaschia claudopus TaxID=2862362 RepID=A0AAW0C0R9_9AGAR